MQIQAFCGGPVLFEKEPRGIIPPRAVKIGTDASGHAALRPRAGKGAAQRREGSILFGIRKRRTLIRVLSYTVSAFAVAVILAASGFVMAYKYRMGIEYSYQRALSELNNQVNNINLALEKGIYSSTPSQLLGLAAEIWSDAGTAKSDISQLSVSDVQLDKTVKFISQTGDFANSLARKIATNGTITAEDRKTLQTLLANSTKLSDELGTMMNELQRGRMTLFKSERAYQSVAVSAKQSVATAGDGLAKVEKSFASLPSMIYDGPFSDSVLKREPLMVKNARQISRDDARAAAAKFLGCDASALKDAGETAGSLATYNFTNGSVSAFVCKKGGFVARMIDSRAVGDRKIDGNAALQKAQKFLSDRGYQNFTQTYSLTNNGICMINFAAVQNGVVCYPDLVKVSVALDNGAIVSFDQTGMLMNHTDRALPAAKVSKSTLEKELNPMLKLQKVSLVLIPSTDGQEKLCYEFKCINDKKQNVIDYFNARTGVEEQILIVLDTPGGQLPV